MSLDGRAFPAPTLLRELRAADGALLAPSTLALDALGTLHVLASGYHHDGWTNTTKGSFPNGNVTAYYARYPLRGEPSVLPLNGAYDPGALVPESAQADTPVMAVHGTRVWIFWADLVHVRHEDLATTRATSYGVESLDGGLAFRPPYKAESAAAEGFPISLLHDVATFPDGRPLLLSNYFHGPGDHALSVVPLFDPIPPPGSGLTAVAHAPAPPETLPAGDENPTTQPPPVTPTPILRATPTTTAIPPATPPVTATPAPDDEEPPANLTPAPPAEQEPGAGQGGDGDAVVPAALAGAGVVLALAIGLTEAGRYGLGLLAATLYARFSKADTLRHEVRAGIHAHVEKHPGIRYEDLRRDLGLANGVLAYHLRVLARDGYVFSRAEWTRRRFYATGAPAPQARGAHDTVLRLLRGRPDQSAADVARALGMSRQLARYHLKALERAGSVQARGQGQAVRYRAAGEAPARELVTFHREDRA